MAAPAYVDIGANLLSEQFAGKYHGKRAHPADLDTVLQRADAAGVSDIIITAGTLRESQRALALARATNASGKYAARLHTTVGVHPTNTKQLDGEPDRGSDDDGGDAAAAHGGGSSGSGGGGGGGGGGGKRRLTKDEYVAELEKVIADGLTDGVVVSIGECGLDYDRLFFSPKETQLAHFELHFDLAEKYRLPLFLHDRNTGGDFAEIMRRHRDRVPGGVVHSFTGTAAEAREYLDMGLDIGINGCSLKTEDNVAVAATVVPLERLHLETDAPWCEIRRTHASHKHVATTWPAVDHKKYAPDKVVKGRCEPCHIVQVAEVLAGARGVIVAEVAAAALANSRRLFFRK